MAWYRAGTVALTFGNATVTGTGTAFIGNPGQPNVNIGEAFLGPDNRVYEIIDIPSNTTLTISPAYLGSTASSQAYAILPARGRIADLIAETQSLLSSFASVRDGIGAGLISDGSASTPALRFSADQDTGVYRIGANAFGVATGGALRLAVVGTNNFLLGGATTSAYSATNRTAVQIDGVEGVVLAFRTASTNRGYMFATADQILLEAEPTAQLKLSTLGSKPIVIATANVDRFKFLETGPFVGGKAASDVTVQGVEINPSGSFSATSVNTFGGYFNRLSSDGSVISLRRQGTEVGNIFVTTTATTYNTSSDYRLKENLEPLTGSGAFIDALNPVRGTWKNGGDTFIGLIAHEVQEVCETPVATGEKDGEEKQTLAYGAPEIMAHMIAELKSLRARVAALEEAA
ncbi:tail fiber domain-containing protein [Blastomonas sp. CCH2-A2]|uniref:tail fiber domain-containing protein n=1 Tax=Blastomonas sp. CCH2-A2 TaxID=1768788 RepID=UPI0008243C85|nr:tail fiber domain-containing protein [Blastomonas sp. CCH2-A2]